MFAEYFLSLFESGAHRRRHEIFFGHDVVYRLIEIGFKTQVAVSEYAHKPVRVVYNGNARNFVARHKLQRLGDHIFGMQRKRVGNHAVLASLYLVNLTCLLVYRHIFVNKPQPALARHGNRKLVFGDGVHCRAHQRNVELDFVAQLYRQISLTRLKIRSLRYNKNVVEGQAFFNNLFHVVSCSPEK